jgi:RimJ/RimL family protein N-acetyltransferase
MISPSSSLETPRLHLRVMQAADATETYLSWLRDPEVIRFLELRFSGVKDCAELAAFIASVNASADSQMFGIFLKGDGRHIGNIKLGPIVQRHGRSEIGYLIGDRESWGQGYASEAIREVARYGMEQHGLSKITAGCYDTNIGSAKALLKAGFKLEATIPSHCICEGRRVASQLFGLDR